MNNQIIDKRKHKLLIFVLKILPAIMAGSYVIEMISIFLGFGTQVLVNFIGMIVAPILFMYLASYVFKFCEYHRMFLHYIVVCNIIDSIDASFRLPVGDAEFIMIHLFLMFITMVIVLILF